MFGRRYETVFVKPDGPTAPFTPNPVGDAVIGWMFFPEHAGPLEPNGMFRKTNWAKGAWKPIFIGGYTEPTLSGEQVNCDGAETLRRTASAGNYCAGDATFDAQRAYVEAPLPNPDDEANCRDRHFLHHIMVGTLTEARCYAGDYLRLIADLLEENPEQKLKQKLYIRSHHNVHHLARPDVGHLEHPRPHRLTRRLARIQRPRPSGRKSSPSSPTSNASSASPSATSTAPRRKTTMAGVSEIFFTTYTPAPHPYVPLAHARRGR